MIRDELDSLRAALEAIPPADPMAEAIASDRLDRLLRVANGAGVVAQPDINPQLVLLEPASEHDEGRRAEGRSPSGRWLRVVIVCLLVAVGGAAIFEASSSHRDTEVPTGSLAAEIDQLAVNTASGDNDSSPGTVTWVATTRDAANQLLWGVTMSESSPAYVLEITPGGGTFELAGACDTPELAAEHKSCAIRAVLDLVIDRQTGLDWDVGSTATAKSLVSLGTPETDSLAGISPDPAFRWKAPLSALAREIDQFAVDQAAAAGNRHPQSVAWVATTDEAATAVFNGGTPSAADDGGPPVYALVITGGGDFTDHGRGGSSDGTVPSGPTLVVIVDQSSWQMDGGGVNFAGAPPPELASLGTPETDSLVGITPMSFAEFSAKYKISPAVS